MADVGGNVAGAKAEAAAKQDSALRALGTLRDGTVAFPYNP